MSTDQPHEPRSPSAADGVLIAPDPAPPTAFRSVGRWGAVGVYGLLWVVAGLIWAVPMWATAAAFADSDRGTLIGLLTGAAPVALFAVWAAMRTASSSLAHRRMFVWGATVGVGALVGCYAFYQAAETTRAAVMAEELAKHDYPPEYRPTLIFVGFWEGVSAVACGIATGGCLTLAFAGAWGRWVLHRGPDAATGDQ